MDNQELRTKLSELKIDPSSYNLGGVSRENSYSYGPSSARWIVYYYERGEKNILAHCDSEDEARCTLLDELVKDLSTRIGAWNKRPKWWKER